MTDRQCASLPWLSCVSNLSNLLSVLFFCFFNLFYFLGHLSLFHSTSPGRLKSCLSSVFLVPAENGAGVNKKTNITYHLSTGRLESCLSTLTPLPPLPSHTDGAHKCQLGKLGQVGSCKIKYQETILSQESSELSRRHSSPCCFSLSHIQPLILMLKVKAPTFSWRPRRRTVKII